MPYLPANAGATVDSLTPNLVVYQTNGKFVAATGLIYQFVVETAAGATVYVSDAGRAAGGHAPTPRSACRPGSSSNEVTYRWRARAVVGHGAGPVVGLLDVQDAGRRRSPRTSCRPTTSRTNSGTTSLTARPSATIVGGTFVAGKGILLPTFESHVTYQLQNTLTAGVTSSSSSRGSTPTRTAARRRCGDAAGLR